MSYRADMQVIDAHTQTGRYTDMGDDKTRRPILASGKNHGLFMCDGNISKTDKNEYISTLPLGYIA